MLFAVKELRLIESLFSHLMHEPDSPNRLEKPIMLGLYCSSGRCFTENGLSEPEFYSDLVYKFRKIVDNIDFSNCHSLQKDMLHYGYFAINYMHVCQPNYPSKHSL